MVQGGDETIISYETRLKTDKGCLQNKKRVNFGTLAQKGGGGNGKIPDSYQ